MESRGELGAGWSLLEVFDLFSQIPSETEGGYQLDPLNYNLLNKIISCNQPSLTKLALIILVNCIPRKLHKA